MKEELKEELKEEPKNIPDFDFNMQKNRGGSEYTKHQSTRAERKTRRKMQKLSRRANR